MFLRTVKGLATLSLVWLWGILNDGLWLALDHSVPAWDQSDYLTGALKYWQALQTPHWFSGEWWTNFWQLSHKVPPLTYILTAPFLNLFGVGPDQAMLVSFLFSGILLSSVYGLGLLLFNQQVAIWAAILCVLMPGIYRFRLQYLLDYPLIAMVTLSFLCLTAWWITGEARGRKEEGKREKEDREEGEEIEKEAAIKKEDKGIETKKYLPRLPSADFAVSCLCCIAFGFSLGLAILVKQTAAFFLFAPILWLLVGETRQKRWGRLAQLIFSLFLSVAVFGPWVRANWLLMLTAGKRATLDSAQAEGDPALYTLDAWTYYWEKLPSHVSWPLLLVPLVGFLLHWVIKLMKDKGNSNWEAGMKTVKTLPLTSGISISHCQSFKWIAVFWVGAYLMSSLNPNKDFRYTLPYLPVLSIFLAYGLTLWSRRWGSWVRWGMVSLATVVMLLNLWPIPQQGSVISLTGYLGSQFVNFLSPGGDRYAYLGNQWPHEQVIADIVKTDPYLRSTLGVLPSTPEVNQHNLNYFGALANFQVYGRQVGTQPEQVPQDVRSLSWFVTKTGDQGSLRKRTKQAQAAMVETIRKSDDFRLQKTWLLPDNSTLFLYRQRVPPVEIKPMIQAQPQVALNQVVVPTQVPPGMPIPVTYQWSGPWEQLQQGLVLLNWQRQIKEGGKREAATQEKVKEKGGNGDVSLSMTPVSTSRWFHDHAIGMGGLHTAVTPTQEAVAPFQVIERMAMMPPADIAAGTYTLAATYLNRKTGETYSLRVPPVTLKINAAAPRVPAPELDLLTQFRQLATNLPKGIIGLEPVFNVVGRINQYDPIQDYTRQAEQALTYRVQQEPQNLELAYALALSRVLQQKPEGAIAALQRVTQLDAQNPYPHAYLAFVYLYKFDGKAAEAALKPALVLNPDQPEFQALNGVAALMQGHFVKAWQDLQALKKIQID